jgi:hypothetical protein
MRISTLDSPWLKPVAAKRKESALKGVRRNGEPEFAVESGLLILMKRITRAQSRGIVVQSTMKKTMISLAVGRLRMEDREGTGLGVRGPLVRNLVERGVKERGLIDRGDTETSLIMMSLGTASLMRR